jgi:hypothetical protein
VLLPAQQPLSTELLKLGRVTLQRCSSALFCLELLPSLRWLGRTRPAADAVVSSSNSVVVWYKLLLLLIATEHASTEI